MRECTELLVFFKLGTNPFHSSGAVRNGTRSNEIRQFSSPKTKTKKNTRSSGGLRFCTTSGNFNKKIRQRATLHVGSVVGKVEVEHSKIQEDYNARDALVCLFPPLFSANSINWPPL